MQDGPSQCGIGPPSQVGGQARAMGRDDRHVRDELLHEVAIAHRVDRVGERSCHAEPLRRGHRVETEGRGGDGASAERRDGGAVGPASGSREVAEHRPGVREEVVTQRHGLREPGVGGAGHHRGLVLARTSHQGSRELDEARVDPFARSEQPEPEVGHHQIVAGTTRVQLGAEVAQPLGHGALDEGMHVLVPGVGCRASRGDLGRDLAQGLDEPAGFHGIEQAGGTQRTDMRDRGIDVVRCEPHVVVQRPAKRVGLGGRRGGESPRPQRLVRTGAHAFERPWVADHTFNGMP